MQWRRGIRNERLREAGIRQIESLGQQDKLKRNEEDENAEKIGRRRRAREGGDINSRP